MDPNAPPKASGGAAGDGDAGDSDQGPKLSATLIDELATQRRQILVAHLASYPSMALDLTIFLMAQNVVFEQSYIPNHSTLKSGAAALSIFAFRDEGSMASQTIDDQRQRLDTSWAGHKTMTERFDAFRALDDEARGAWVAYSIARTLEPTLNVAEGCRSSGNAGINRNKDPRPAGRVAPNIWGASPPASDLTRGAVPWGEAVASPGGVPLGRSEWHLSALVCAPALPR